MFINPIHFHCNSFSINEISQFYLVSLFFDNIYSLKREIMISYQKPCNSYSLTQPNSLIWKIPKCPLHAAALNLFILSLCHINLWFSNSVRTRENMKTTTCQNLKIIDYVFHKTIFLY